MKQSPLTPNIDRLRAQLETLIPSSDAVKVLDALLRLVGATRWEIGRKIGTDGVVVAWAFEKGKRKRAAEVRKDTLAIVDEMIEAQRHGTAVAA